MLVLGGSVDLITMMLSMSTNAHLLLIPDTSVSYQVKIVKLCSQLGVGPGGFYRPGYRNGALLKLWMMCLGKNWDPDSSSYGDRRLFDGAQPPTIPEEFQKFVQDGIQASHEFLKQQKGATNVVQEIPAMSPDICIVNFYNSSGRLGLHQVQKKLFLC